MLVALAGFGYLACRKLAIVASLQPEMRWDRPLARLRAYWSTVSCSRG